MRLLHISPDEKFINNVNYLFEKALPNNNHFYIIKKNLNDDLKYVNSSTNVFLFDFKNILKQISTLEKKYDLIFLHGLFHQNARIFNEISNKDAVVVIFWGGEVYDNNKIYPFNIFLDQTSLLSKRLSSVNSFSKIKNNFYDFFFNTRLSRRQLLNLYNSIKHFGVIHKEEVEHFKKIGILSNEVNHFFISYYPIEFILKDVLFERQLGNNILVGNSASLSSNHLEIFSILSEFSDPIDNRQIIVPLNYGDPNYATAIKNNGYKIFKNKFVPLLEYLSLSEYNKILSTCGIAIMNHKRQQAVGNIVALIYMGSKVYLRKSNTIYHYLKRIGIHVFAIEDDLVISNINAFELLNQSEIEHNRNVLFSHLSEKNLIDSLVYQVNKLHENSTSVKY